MNSKHIIWQIVIAFTICLLIFSTVTTAQTASIELVVTDNEYSLGENINVQAHLTANSYVTFEMNDNDGNPVMIMTNQTDSNGFANVTFNLDDGEDIGNYTIYASADNYGTSLTGSIPVKLSYPSPITFSSEDITFSVLNPSSGQSVQIYALFHNSASTAVIGRVSFFDMTTSAQIGAGQLIWFPSNDQKVASIEWTPTTSGIHTILVSVDCGVDYKEFENSVDITVGGSAQPNLVLTTGDINIYRLRPGETRTLSVDVTCYSTTVTNVHLICLDNQNLTVDTSITPARTMNDGETIPFYLRVTAPDAESDEATEFRIILQVKGDGAYSNAEPLDIVMTGSALDFFIGNIGLFGAAGAGIGLSVAGFAINRKEPWKYFLYSVMLAPMYVKLKKGKVLDHFVRGQIFGHIKTNPGAHYNEIKEILGVANGVLAHHLRTLEREEFIKSRKDGNLKRFYPIDMNIDVDKHGIQLSQAQLEIINIVKQKPGITQSDIARLLNKDRRAVAYHVKEMERMDIIRLERSGRETNCYLGDVEVNN